MVFAGYLVKDVPGMARASGSHHDGGAASVLSPSNHVSLEPTPAAVDLCSLVNYGLPSPAGASIQGPKLLEYTYVPCEHLALEHM